MSAPDQEPYLISPSESSPKPRPAHIPHNHPEFMEWCVRCHMSRDETREMAPRWAMGLRAFLTDGCSAREEDRLDALGQLDEAEAEVRRLREALEISRAAANDMRRRAALEGAFWFPWEASSNAC